MGNYDFLKEKDGELLDLLLKVEKFYSKKDYENSVARIRKVLEGIIQSLCKDYNETYSRMSLNDYSKNLFKKHLHNKDFREDFYKLKSESNPSNHYDRDKKITYSKEKVEDLLYNLCFFVCDYFEIKYKQKVPSFEYKLPEQKSDEEIEKELILLKRANEEKDKKIAEKDKIIEEQKNSKQTKIFIKNSDDLKTDVLKAIELFGTNGWAITCGQIHKFLVDGYVKIPSLINGIRQDKRLILQSPLYHKYIDSGMSSKLLAPIFKILENEGFIKYNNDEFKSYTYLKGGVLPKVTIKQTKSSISVVKPEKSLIQKENSNNIDNIKELMKAELKAEMEKEYKDKLASIQQTLSEIQKQRNSEQENLKKLVDNKNLQLESIKKELQEYKNACINDIKKTFENSITKEEKSETSYYYQGYVSYINKEYDEAENFFKLAIENNSNIADSYCLLAHISIINDDIPKSVKYYTKAINSSPNKPSYYIDRANAYYEWAECVEDEDFERAEKYYKKAVCDWEKVLELEPDYGIDYFNLAWSERAIGENKEAKKYYKIFVENNPDSENLPHAYNNLGIICKKEKLYDEAIQYYTNAINIYKTQNIDNVKEDLARTYNNRAYAYYNWAQDITYEDFDATIEYYKKAIDNWNNVLSLNLDYNIDYFDLAWSKWAIGEEEDAKKCYKIFVENNPDSENLPHAYNNLGNIYKDENLYNEAIQYYTNAIDIYENQNKDNVKEDLARTYNNCAEAYYYWAKDIDNKDFDAAEGYYKKAVNNWGKTLKLQPDYNIDYFDLAWSERKIGNNNEAKKYYTIFIENNPDSKDLSAAYNNRGVIYKDQEDYESAIKDYSKAIKINKTKSFYCDNRAEAYYYLAKDIADKDFETAKVYYKKAINDWEKTLKLEPDYDIDYFKLAWSEDSIGGLEKAKKYYTIFIENNPDSEDIPAAYNNRGVIFEQQEDFSNAKKDYQKAHNLDKENELYVSNLNNVKKQIKELQTNKNNDNLKDLMNEAQVEYDNENYTSAIEKFIQIYKTQPDYLNIVTVLIDKVYDYGKILIKQEDWDTVTNLCTTIIDLEIEHEKIYNLLGAVNFCLGNLYILDEDYDAAKENYLEAQKYFEIALDINPNYENAICNLNNIVQELNKID